MESLPEIQAGITVPSRDQQERSSWRAIPTPEWIRVLIEKGTERIEKDLALLNWMHSEIDLIEADLPSKRTTAANSSDC